MTMEDKKTNKMKQANKKAEGKKNLRRKVDRKAKVKTPALAKKVTESKLLSTAEITALIQGDGYFKKYYEDNLIGKKHPFDNDINEVYVPHQAIEDIIKWSKDKKKAQESIEETKKDVKKALEEIKSAQNEIEKIQNEIGKKSKKTSWDWAKRMFYNS